MKTAKNLRALIEKTLERADFEGFTIPLKGKPERYVVAMTNNVGEDTDIRNLAYQVGRFWKEFKTITIGGWQAPNGDKFIDIGTTLNTLEAALELGRAYNQQAIWDLKEGKEIFCN